MRPDNDEFWPSLPLAQWRDTCETLQLWTQIVGKIRLSQTPWTNHSWHVTLYLTARGLTTTPIAHGFRTFEIEFDFIDHRLVIRTNDGARRELPLRAQPVAEFYRDVFEVLRGLNFSVHIHAAPNEVERAVPFAEDYEHASYDPVFANRFWRVLVQSDRVMKAFRARFIGKCSPVHFFWGGPDLAVTRFSGRPAPAHPGGVPNLPDWIARDAYSHEVSSCGFWPGGDAYPFPSYYSYAYPEPDGFPAAKVAPDTAFYSTSLHEYLLPYEEVRQSASPDATLTSFLESTYSAAADLARWDRASLEQTLSRDVQSRTS
jgi:hypothetical protein